MKHFTRYLLTVTIILLGVIKVTAQTECPNIEWMRFFNNDNNVSYIITNVDSYYNEVVTGSYKGNFTFGTYNLPTPPNFIGNAFIGKVDATGNPLWVKAAENFTYSPDFFFFSNPVVDSLGNIYTILNFTWKTIFAGTTYTTNGQQQNALFIKMSPQGQVLATHLFEGFNIFLNHIDHGLNLYCSTNFEDTIAIDSHTYISNGGKDILIFKLSPQLQLLWAKQIGGNKDDFFPLFLYDNSANSPNSATFKVDDQNNVYIAGSFESSSMTLGSFVLNNSYPNGNQFETFMAKIDSARNYSWAKSIADPDFSLRAMAIDNYNNVYITGYITDTIALGNNNISSLPANSLNSILIKYNPEADSFSSMVLRGGWNRGEYLLYLSQKNMMVLSGSLDADTIDFYIDSVGAHNMDFYVLGIDLSGGAEKMVPQWVLHSQGNGTELLTNLSNDFEDNIYLSGGYSDDLGDGAFGNYTFPAILGNGNNIFNGYQAKLSFLNREVTVSNGVLTAVQDSAIYQWLDCSNGMQPVPGATQQSFDPVQPGSYAVQVSNSFCSVVSDCLSTTGISEVQRLRQVRIYPNPVAQMLHLKGLPPGTQVTVFDVLGRAIYSVMADKTDLDIDTHPWPQGLYMLSLSRDGVTHLEKVVKD